MRIRSFAYIVFSLFFVLNATAFEIVSVTRDFYYPNIFVYKERLIEKSNANAFDFEDIYEREAQPEIFIVKIKTQKDNFGKTINAVFEYKTHKSNKFLSKSKSLKIFKKKHNLEFIFPSSLVQTEGRVEIWNVKLFCEGKEISNKSSNYYRSRD